MAARRRVQVERATKASQESVIQKILGQDSTPKRREEKLLKQRRTAEQERKAAELEPARDSIRLSWTPAGAFVSFSPDVDIAPAFRVAPADAGYPPPRERCAAASGSASRYRHATSRLPLCSLACFRTLTPPDASAC
eukprot:SM001177S25548  [mRNA]  locus=s1177:387:1203:+ [translate_table: standard]